ncbi:phosphotransferase [Mycobacterium sp. NPDC006124]|uniref:phosphotransferase n=1 Tax=Mycobacterium sp. NPDC006124 TaxID=3156729 RepID=UPI0033B774A5
MSNTSGVLARIARASALESGGVAFPAERVAVELRRLYGLTGWLTRIATEKDDTFRLDGTRGRFLVKIAPASESARIVNLQSAVMLHLANSADPLPAQRLIRGLHGQVESTVVDPEGNDRILRVLSFLDGSLLATVAPTPAQLVSVGSTLARLDVSLRDFTHADDTRLLIWDLKNFSHLRPLLEWVTDRDDVEMATWVFDQFDALVVPRIADLDSQMIHGDFSPFNVVVDSTSKEFVTGIIDFGDVVRSPRVFELSVAVANQIGADERRPWASALDIVRGYQQVRPLPAEDVSLLAVTGPARLLLRALIYGWRAATHAHTREYGLSHSAPDWIRLRCALSVASSTVDAMLAATADSVPLDEGHRP